MKLSTGLLLFVSSAFSSVFSAPVPHNHAASTGDVSHYTHPTNIHPAFDGDLFVSHDEHAALGSREYAAVDLLPRTRGAAKVAKAAAKAVRVQKAHDKGKVAPKRPANAKVTFGDAARANLDALGLHGKDRKKVKNYHKAIVKQDMPKHGADSARIFHLAHKGGNDPNERNHITAGYYKPPAHGKPGEQIKSPWAVKHEAENPGKTTKGLFHVYPEDQKHNHPPAAWNHAVAASDARKHAEAEHARAQAEREAAEKAHRASQAKEAGQSLSAEEKKAQREAAKAAKLAKKGGRNGS